MGKGRYILALTSFLVFSLQFNPTYGSMRVNVMTPGGHGALYPGDTVPYTVTFDTPRDRVPRTPLYVVLVPTPDPENPGAPRPIFPWTLTLSDRTTTDASRKIPSDLKVFGNFTIDIHSGKDVYGPLLAYSNSFTISPIPLYRKILDAPFVIQTTWGTYLKFITIYLILVYIWSRWRRRYLKRKLTPIIAQAIARARAQGRAEAQESRGELVPIPTFLTERNQARSLPRPNEDDIEVGHLEGGMDRVDESPVTSANIDVETPPLIDLAPLAPTFPAHEKGGSILPALAADDAPVSGLTSLMVHDPYCEPLAGLSVGQTAASPSSSTVSNGALEEMHGGNVLTVRIQELTNTVEHLQTLLAIQSSTAGDQTRDIQGEDDLVPPPMYSEASR